MIQDIQTLLITGAAFILVLGLVVTIHELGHFMAAKWCGVAIDRFSINFGRALVSWKDRSGVRWQIGWLPLGGYVRFAGDETVASVPDPEDLKVLRRQILQAEGAEGLKRYFFFKPVWQRAIVVVAGPVANFLLSTVIFAVLLMAVGEELIPPRIGAVVPGSVASRAGFQAGDTIKSVDGRSLNDFKTLAEYVAYRANTPIRFTIARGDRTVEILAAPAYQVRDNPLGGQMKVGTLGLRADPKAGVVFKRYGPVKAIGGGAQETWDTLSTTVFVLGRLIHGQVPANQLNGPLGIAQLSGAVAIKGAEGAPNLWMALEGSTIYLLQLAALLSVSIGFMNLLPVPVLDGGHLLFYAYEAVARRPVGANIQAAGYRVGLALLLGLMLFATWNDLQRYRVFHFLGGLFS